MLNSVVQLSSWIAIPTPSKFTVISFTEHDLEHAFTIFGHAVHPNDIVAAVTLPVVYPAGLSVKIENNVSEVIVVELSDRLSPSTRRGPRAFPPARILGTEEISQHFNHANFSIDLGSCSRHSR